MKNLLAAALIAALAGCVSSGPKIDATQLSEIRKGQTTLGEIQKQFGRPNMTSKNMDGSVTAIYVHAEDEKGVSIAPVSATLTGSLETVTFSFDAKGILTDYKYSPPSISSKPAAAAATGSAQPAAAAAPAATGATPQTAAGATNNVKTTATSATPPQTSNATAAAGTGKTEKSVPYIWEILRASKSSDPRNP